MQIVQSYPVAVFLLIISMLCWGSWANTQKLSSKKWSFQLFYWDYTLGLVILSLLLGLTVGSSVEEGRGFLADLQQGSWGALSAAFLGGVIFNIANLLVVAAIDIAGMAVAFPIAIGLALVLGVVINYIGEAKGDPFLLFLGVTLVALAIVLNAIAYRKMSKSEKKTSSKGIIISIIGGIIMGFFYRFVADSLVTDFSDPEAGQLTPYTAVFIFSVGVFISNFLWNSIFMYKPIAGKAVTYSDYFKNGNFRLHAMGILGGMIWLFGMFFSILSSDLAGPAISYGLSQGATMVAAIWGVFIWKEFKGAPKGTNTFLYLMFIFFIVGLILIIIAR
ncbi:MAG: multidrug DMT transporter permease [Bacteroidetes bacterium]|nr:multidrug DMT transporter permease [Bacteroidota bacterium]